MAIIAPSILSANWTSLEAEISAVEKAGADWIHLDVMDGHFVPPITFGAQLAKAARSVTKLPLDAHLMIENPENQIEAFKTAGVDYLTVHVEACPHLHRVLQQIKEAKIKVGVALNPATSLESVKSVLNLIDLLLIMTVNPGWGGQKFIPETISKIREARTLRDQFKLNFKIEVDGGINSETAKDVIDAGADVLVAGNHIFSSSNYSTAISSLKK